MVCALNGEYNSKKGVFQRVKVPYALGLCPEAKQVASCFAVRHSVK